MNRRALRIAVACALVVVGACKDDPAGPETNASRQAAAKALWQSTRPTRYTFVAVRVCECPPTSGGPVRVEVNGTAIVSVRRVDNDATVDPALWFNVESLFSLIDTELVQRPSRLEAEYDTHDGHPTYIAYGEREVDNGAVIELTGFTALIGGTSGYLRR